MDFVGGSFGVLMVVVFGCFAFWVLRFGLRALVWFLFRVWVVCCVLFFVGFGGLVGLAFWVVGFEVCWWWVMWVFGCVCGICFVLLFIGGF